MKIFYNYRYDLVYWRINNLIMWLLTKTDLDSLCTRVCLFFIENLRPTLSFLEKEIPIRFVHLFMLVTVRTELPNRWKRFWW